MAIFGTKVLRLWRDLHSWSRIDRLNRDGLQNGCGYGLDNLRYRLDGSGCADCKSHPDKLHRQAAFWVGVDGFQ
jgi:hypothetical protein